MLNKKKLLIVGAGYVGSASAIHLGLLGHQVEVFDINTKTKNEWAKQKLPYEDQDLIQGLKQLKKNKNLPRVADKKIDLSQYKAVLICVSTPALAGRGYDNSFVLAAVEQIIKGLQKSRHQPAIIIRSTLAPNTMRLIMQKYSDYRTKPNLIYFPEFLREGSALHDLRHPPLSVFGVSHTKENVGWVVDLFGLKKDHVHITNYNVAEMVKVTSNIYHALKVCFANEIGQSSARLGIDGAEVMRIFADDKVLNISPAYFKPGFAYGGPCLEKDLQGLLASQEIQKMKNPLLHSIAVSNEELLQRVYLDLKKKKNSVKTIGILGLSFKAGSVDQRNSPVARLVDKLKKDFKVMTLFEVHSQLKKASNLDQLLSESDLVLIGSRLLKPSEIKQIIKSNKEVLDLKINFKNSEKFAGYVNYKSIMQPVLLK